MGRRNNYPENRRGGACPDGCTCGRHSHRESWAAGRSPEYSAWVNLRYRCNNPGAPAYANYGGRGVKVCERWDSFENFLVDMGRRPSPRHSIDRRDNDGDYTPENCRWATATEQLRNRRNIKLTQRDADAIRSRTGVTRRALAEEYGVSPSAIGRVQLGESWT